MLHSESPATPGAAAIGQAPRLGHVEIGAFAPEAAALYGIDRLSLSNLDDENSYSRYRAGVRGVYGADLADMNYLSVGVPGWETRFGAFRDWLFRAARYGEPTIAIEPLGKAGYGAFRDTPEMQRLRAVLEEARQSGIVVWVRFASESNLRFSLYSVYNDPVKVRQYRHSVRWFRDYMPRNVRLVFSPLINTACLRASRQLWTLQHMYARGDYDRIGGTIYATTTLRLQPAYTWYHAFMRRLDPTCPFQICELGGIYTHRADVEGFLRALAHGAWPDVERVNLFAGDLNAVAVKEHGHFGFLEPGATVSYIAEFFGAPDAPPHKPSGSEELALGGIALQIDRRQGCLVMRADWVTNSLGERTALSPARRKRVLIGPGTVIGIDGVSQTPPDDSALHVGDTVEASGWDNGAGTAFHAARIDATDR